VNKQICLFNNIFIYLLAILSVDFLFLYTVYIDGSFCYEKCANLARDNFYDILIILAQLILLVYFLIGE